MFFKKLRELFGSSDLYKQKEAWSHNLLHFVKALQRWNLFNLLHFVETLQKWNILSIQTR